MSIRVARLGAVAVMLAAGASAAAAQQDLPRDIMALRRFLVAHDFPALDSALASRAAEARADVGREARYVFAFDAFASGDSLLQPHFDAWIASEPWSPIPRAARAVYFRAMGVAASGHGPIDPPDSEAARELAQWTVLARADAVAAYRRDPMEPMVYAAVLDLCVKSADVITGAIRASPGTLLLRARYMESLGPKCGGTLADMTRFAAAEQREWRAYPPLRILEVLPSYYAAFDDAERAGHRRTIAAYSRAIARHDFWQLRYGRALEYLRIRSFPEAIADLDHVVADRPGYVAALAWRAAARTELAKHQRGESRERLMVTARADIDMAVALNRFDPQVAFILGERREDDRTANSMP